MSDENQGFGTAELMVEQGPIEAMYRLQCAIKAKWAIKITGKDESGTDRCLGLDWDGVWHPLDPVTGQHTRIGAIVKFRDLRVGEVALDTYSEARWPYAARVGERKWTWEKPGERSTMFGALDMWGGEDDLVRIFSVTATAENLRQIIDQHHDAATEAKR